MIETQAESISWLRFAIASFTVITLLVALAWSLKMATQRGWLSPTKIGRNKRLRLLSALTLDARRRVVLIQKDDKEYTLLVGGNSDVVIDTSPAKAPLNKE